MPITLELKPEHKLIIFIHKGEISDDEFLEFYWQYFKDEAAPGIRVLVDLREADSRPRNPGTLHQFAIFMKDHLKDSPVHPKVAIVAPKALSFGLARMYQSYAESVPWEFVVFRAVDAALAWLDVPEDLIDSGEKV